MKTRYEAETVYTLRNFTDFYKTIARKKHHFFLKHGIIEAIIILGGVLGYFKMEYDDIGLMFGATAILYPWFVSTMQKVNIRKQWRLVERRWGKTALLTFYDEFFEQTVNGKTTRFGYYELQEILESRTHFHLLINNKNAMSLEKEACSPELQTFLRELDLGGK